MGKKKKTESASKDASNKDVTVRKPSFSRTAGEPGWMTVTCMLFCLAKQPPPEFLELLTENF